jgi:hypothetical protein
MARLARHPKATADFFGRQNARPRLAPLAESRELIAAEILSGK